MAIELLSAGRVEAEIKRKIKKPAMFHDGGGLYLQVARSGSVSWIFRFKSPITGKSRDMGLGAAHKLPLARARDEADRLREMVHVDKLDPIIERDNAKAKAGSAATFRQRFEFMMQQQERHGWRNLLELHAMPAIGDKIITAITTDDIVGIIGGLLKQKKFETARKLQQRIQVVIKSATNSLDTVAHKAYVCNTLPAFKKVRKNKSYAAIHYTKVPDFVATLRRGPASGINGRNVQGIAYLALEFVILTVCRTGDVVGARRNGWPQDKKPMRWMDVDLKRKVWIVPAVKTADEHDPQPFEIPLSDAAIDVLMRVKARKVNECRPADWVFASDFRGATHKPMAPTAMIHVLHDMQAGFTVHGMRTAFRGYASNVLTFDNEVIETAMAHRIFSKDKAEAAYKDQVNFFEKRRDLMNRWADYVTGKRKVVRLKAA